MIHAIYCAITLCFKYWQAYAIAADSIKGDLIVDNATEFWKQQLKQILS